MVSDTQDLAQKTSDGKKVISAAQKTALIGSGIDEGRLEELYTVEQSESKEDQIEADEKKDLEEEDIEDDLDEEDDDLEEDDLDDDDDDEEDVDDDTTEASNVVDEDGYEVVSLGALTIRRRTDGSGDSSDEQVFTKVDGVEGWVNSDVYVKGYQIREHNERRSQELNKRESRLEELEESLGVVDYLSGRAGKKKRDEDDLEDIDEDDEYSSYFDDDDEDDDSESEVAKLRRELDELKGVKTKAQRMQAADQAEIESSFLEMSEYAKEQGWELPDNDTLRAVLKIEAENRGVDMKQVAKSPIGMIKVLKAARKRSSKKSLRVKAGTKLPPKAAGSSGRRTPKSKLRSLEKKIAKVRKEAADPYSNSDDSTAELIRLNRQRNKLLSKDKKG